MEQLDELQVVPSFGIHPWWAQADTPNNLASLKDTLLRHPTASVGEIGLCKSARGRSVLFEVQEAAFRAQLALAVELKRTCVVHCVGYYGKLLEILQGEVRAGNQLPRAIVLHSYSGAPEMVRSFLSIRGTSFYFSLNAKQLTDPRMKKAAACCAALPQESLLLETDAPDQAPSLENVEDMLSDQMTKEGIQLDLSPEVNEPAMVYLALARAAQIRGVTRAELAVVVLQNCTKAFDLDIST